MRRLSRTSTPGGTDENRTGGDRLVPRDATPGGLRAQVLSLQRQAWPGAAPGHDPALRPLSMLLVDDGLVLAALDILFKEIVHAGRRWGRPG
jgi:aminoglycoside 2'-N-acetyltransferase I